MVERSELLIGGWRWLAPGELPGWDQPGWGRSISEPATGVCLGFVRAAAPHSWRWRGPWSWLAGRRLDVLETEDASLLMSVRHPWLGCGRWHVVDAENRRLGIIQRPHVLDGDRGWLGTVDRDGTDGRFRLASGEVAARFEKQDAGLVVRHAADVDPNPFLRMVVLGAALALAPRPAATP
jgi:hypothetical protein